MANESATPQPGPPSIVPVEALLQMDRSRLRLLDARGGRLGVEHYRAGHIEGAVHVDLELDLSGDSTHPERGGRHPLPSPVAWSNTLGRLGITPETSVIVYDDQGGAVAAARTWWMLRAAGHRKVSVMDGSLRHAERAGMPMSQEAPAIAAVDPYPFMDWSRPLVGFEAVKTQLADPQTRLVDARAAARFSGQSEPFDPVPGHIPGAINVPFSHHLDANGCWLSRSALRDLYREALGSLEGPKHIIASCGSGVTACHTLLALERAGVEGAALYVGSWSEWCRRTAKGGP